MNHRINLCPSCSGIKNAKQYLCRPCWLQLHPGARRQLRKRDVHAVRRFTGLLYQIENGVPLGEIRIESEYP